MTQITVHNTYGALAVGICIAIFLFGVVSFQVFDYFTNFSDDRPAFRAMIAALWLFELGHIMALTSQLYLTVIPSASKQDFLGMSTALIFGALTTLIVQGFFSRRISKLLPRPYHMIGGICFVLTLFRTGGTIFLAAEAIKSGNMVLFRVKNGWLITALFTLNTVLDLLIAVSLTSYLLMQKNDHFGRFEQVVDRLVAYTIRTGALTSVTSIAALVCFEVMPLNFIWIGIYCVLAKLYSTSLLSSFVQRRELRNRLGENSSAGRTHESRGSWKEESSLSRPSGGATANSNSLKVPVLINRNPTPEIAIEMHPVGRGRESRGG